MVFGSKGDLYVIFGKHLFRIEDEANLYYSWVLPKHWFTLDSMKFDQGPLPKEGWSLFPLLQGLGMHQDILSKTVDDSVIFIAKARSMMHSMSDFSTPLAELACNLANGAKCLSTGKGFVPKVWMQDDDMAPRCQTFVS